MAQNKRAVQRRKEVWLEEVEKSVPRLHIGRDTTGIAVKLEMLRIEDNNAPEVDKNFTWNMRTKGTSRKWKQTSGALKIRSTCTKLLPFAGYFQLLSLLDSERSGDSNADSEEKRAGDVVFVRAGSKATRLGGTDKGVCIQVKEEVEGDFLLRLRDNDVPGKSRRKHFEMGRD
ncbi:hypothetical protein SODALDRAFT_357015 [Sodiomyces alkalinus F11]|uniref:Uncharacterized protein n=1 Tax=Sodiomyces alkalinus (strain CBS 110278 / VKM F-3762 / F11) TaxID=1314773 RepID=A0A3N2Q2J6_SODAK|nr:hypothetical protein SODALDRAFT_357015 [Sodiomyces alkalinus F11]ROT40991.1 hypothetical protein SODALDRAFT_357015 [Sodiomyces alkalinus F11]